MSVIEYEEVQVEVVAVVVEVKVVADTMFNL